MQHIFMSIKPMAGTTNVCVIYQNKEMYNIIDELWIYTLYREIYQVLGYTIETNENE